MPDPRGFKPCMSGEILECINLTEYAALTAANKTRLDTVLSCTYLDMRVGKKARIIIYDIFGSSPLTLAALNTLLDK